MRMGMLSTMMLTVVLAGPAPASAGMAELQVAVERIAKAAPGRVGLAATLLETGETVAWRADESFYAQSTYKIPIAMAALDRASRLGWRHEKPVPVLATDLVPGAFASPVRQAFYKGRKSASLDTLVGSAIAMSDNTASDVLLRFAGGPAAVDAYVAGLGVSGVTVATSLRHFKPERNLTTPRAMLALLEGVERGTMLKPADRELLLDRMKRCKTGPGRLKGRLPAGAVVAHKTGTSGTYRGVTPAINDVGIMYLPNGRRAVVAAFVAEARGTEAAIEPTIAALGKAVWDSWGMR